MSSPKEIEHLNEVIRTLDGVIEAVVERGYHDKTEPFDDYGTLLATFEQRKLVTFQLYDSYFPPKRHEFELQLLTSFVDAVASNPTAVYLKNAAVTGVVGNAAFEVVKHLLCRLSNKSKPIKRTHESFKEMEKNADRVRLFFKKRSRANITEICKVLNTEAGKIEPLMKLLGFSRRRKGRQHIWIAPGSQKTARAKNRNKQ